MISSLAWIPRGLASAEPRVQEFTAGEIEELEAQAVKATAAAAGEDSSSDGDADEGSEDEEKAVAAARRMAAALKAGAAKGGAGKAGETGSDLASALASLDMDRYDDEDSDGGAGILDRVMGGARGLALARASERRARAARRRARAAAEEGGGPDAGAADAEGAGAESSDGGSELESESESEVEAMRLRPSDLLLCATRNEDDVSHLEVWVYEPPDGRGAGNLYVHHSLLLPAFPLASAALDMDPTDPARRGAFAAVSSFDPAIEIWDLDVIDAVEPVAKLGGVDLEKTAAQEAAWERELVAARAKDAKSAKAGKKGGKERRMRKDRIIRPVCIEGSHTDAVLGLSWNSQVRNVLASASADETVKLWDLSTAACQNTLSHHAGKVCSVAWNPSEAHVLASGGYDRRVCVVDARLGDAASASALVFQVPADVEGVAWRPDAPHVLAASLESGAVLGWDVRAASSSAASPSPAPLFSIPSAHEGATTSLGFDPAVPGLLFTSGTDGSVALWDATGDGAASGDAAHPSSSKKGKPGKKSNSKGASLGGYSPSLLARTSFGMGALLAASLCGDEPLLLACGGAGGQVATWDAAASDAALEFARRQAPGAADRAGKRVLGQLDA